MSHNATILWLEAYEAKLAVDIKEFNATQPKSSAEWYEKCKLWLMTAGGRRLWELDMDWNKALKMKINHPFEEMKAFRFQVGLRNYKTPTDHTNGCKMMREVAAK